MQKLCIGSLQYYMRKATCGFLPHLDIPCASLDHHVDSACDLCLVLDVVLLLLGSSTCFMPCRTCQRIGSVPYVGLSDARSNRKREQ